MIEKYELYDSEKKYVTPDGQLYTKEKFQRDYPAVQVSKMAVWVMGDVLIEAFPLSYIQGINKIPSGVEDEKILNIATNNRVLKEAESTPLERIASALEFIELLLYGGGAE